MRQRIITVAATNSKRMSSVLGVYKIIITVSLMFILRMRMKWLMMVDYKEKKSFNSNSEDWTRYQSRI